MNDLHLYLEVVSMSY